MRDFRVCLCVVVVMVGCVAGMLGPGDVLAQQNVVVPNVVGITIEVAAQILRTVGLQPRFQGTHDGTTLVVQQDPQPGILLTAGDEVTLMTTGGVSLQGWQDGGAQTPQPPSTQPLSSGASVSAATLRNPGTGVSVTPLPSGQQTYRQVPRAAQYLSSQESTFTIVHQPQQLPASRYFAADMRPKKYPAWYPKAFLNQAHVSSQHQVAGQAYPQTVVRQGYYATQGIPSGSGTYVTPYGTTDTIQSAWYAGWYAPQQGMYSSSSYVRPHVSTYSYSSQPMTSYSTPGYYSSPSYTSYEPQSYTPTAAGSVPVPNIMRLGQDDAVIAIQKAGLAVGSITLVPEAQARRGVVIRQSPQARAIVPAGTPVHLWVAN
ncbi:PASTA domain-containing protein [candidate division KSB3 bacterium]|uniref:PASTA domain-containing protein n=1 Tax=candidate division KSB3 bacterium TaxID=2044937 RepID=A0A9D5K065_9BACT|nr:PASTA domain-containing protein [candidate division KSB3 bacterium]MBD3327527.1 PASTA domain-containing protein [candidate division KSB3 bacterium]